MNDEPDNATRSRRRAIRVLMTAAALLIAVSLAAYLISRAARISEVLAANPARIKTLIAGLDSNAAQNPTAMQKVFGSIKELRRIGAPAAPHLVEALRAESMGLRLGAASALANMGPEMAEAVPALIMATRDKERMVRSTAAGALSHIAPKSKEACAAAAPQLIEELKQDGSAHWSIRASAASALGRFGPLAVEAVPALENLQNEDTCDSVREAAGKALEKIKRPASSALASGNDAQPDDFAGYRPKSPLARKYLIYWSADASAPPMAVVVDGLRPFGAKLDTVLADLNMDGRIERSEELDKASGGGYSNYSSNDLPGLWGPGTLCKIRVVVSEWEENARVDLFADLRKAENDAVLWSYTFLERDEPGKDPKATRTIHAGNPAKFHLNAEFAGGNLTIEADVESPDGTLLQKMAAGSKPVCPQLEIIDPSGQNIVDKKLEYG